MKEGEWVSGIHGIEKFTGYVLKISSPTSSNHIHAQNCICGAVQDLEIIITFPSHYRGDMIYRNTYEVVPYGNFIHPDDLDDLINLSIKCKDKDWFDELSKEKNLWKSPGDFFG